MTRRPIPTGANQLGPAMTPDVASFGLPNRGLDPRISRAPPLGPVAVPGADTVPTSLDTPATHSPSISIATAGGGLSIDPTAAVPHETFLKMGTWRRCAGTPSSMSTPASCLSILLPFVGCSRSLTWLLRNHPTVSPLFYPQTPPRISPRFSRWCTSRGPLPYPCATEPSH